MSSAKYFVIVLVAFAACAVVAKPRTVAFNVVKNQTICRTRVEYDTNEERIPKTIKMLKCEEDPYEMCPAGDGEPKRCCGAVKLVGAAQFSCIEVQDTVLVQYNTKEGTTEGTFTVAIGCSCIKQDPNKAKE